jgi:hypothetical protein
MCWNETVSINTFLLSTFSVLLALGNNIISPTHALFYMSFMIMQFIEFLIWRKSFSNKTLSMIALIIILTQPIFSLLIIENYNYRINLLISYIIFIFLLLTIIKPWNAIDFRSIKALNGHLAWKWLNFPFYVIVIWMFFFFIGFVLNKRLITGSLVLSMVIISYLLFYKTETWGSIWCHMSNIIAIVLIYYVFKKEFCY